MFDHFALGAQGHQQYPQFLCQQFPASEARFGLGWGDDPVAEVEIYWPVSRTTQTFHDVPVNRFLEIRETEDSWRERKVPRFSFVRSRLP